MKVQLMILLGLSLVTCRTKDVGDTMSEAGRYNQIAVNQQQNGNLDSALFFIDKAISVDSTQYLYYVQRLTFLWALNRNAEALVTAKKVSRLRNYNNVSMEGIAYEKLGDLEKAMELYRNTVDGWPLKELEDYQARIEYAQLMTVVYGKDRGLEELNKIDETKLPDGQYKVIEYIRQSVTTYNGQGFLAFKYPNEVQTNN